MPGTIQRCVRCDCGLDRKGGPSIYCLQQHRMCILLIKTIIKENWYTRVRYLLDNLCLSELEYKKMKMRKYYVIANAGNRGCQ